MTPTVQALISRAAEYDPQLAQDIKDYCSGREYGLVFEHNRPEAMRLWGKPVSVGDKVNILPPRGSEETDGNHAEWTVVSKNSTTATVIRSNEEPRAIPLEDLVALTDYTQPIYAGLKETGRVMRGKPQDPCHVVINGENYHALEALTFAYAGKVDCIYIDPPYNTGAKDWKYNNDYVGGDDEYRHSKWLAFMERRLKLAKQLLNPNDSVLIVTIDEKEYLRLGLLLEQLFPESNIQMASSVISRKGSNRRTEFSRCAEYIYFVMNGQAFPHSSYSDMNGTGKESSSDSPVCWQYLKRRGTSYGASRKGRPGLFYPIFINESDNTFNSVGNPLPRDTDRHEVIPPAGTWAAFPLRPNGEEGCWQVQPSRFVEQLEEGTCYLSSADREKEAAQFLYLKENDRKKVLSGDVKILGRDENGRPILSASNEGKKVRPKDVWVMDSHDATHGTNMLNSIFKEKRFPFPKSLYAVEDSIRFFIDDKPEAVVLDFFAGSGTTAHAVMRLNHQDGGHRQCICITNNEVSEKEEKRLTKEGKRYGDLEWEALGICEYVTKPRIQAAITGLTPDGTPIKGDYKFVDEFPMSDGFDANAVFFDFEYLSPDAVELGFAFRQVAPLLWMRAGSRGPIIDSIPKEGFALSDFYGVLFDWSKAREFAARIENVDTARTVYVVTDDATRYQTACSMFPDRDVVQLYESYLQSFEIAAEGAVR